MTDTNPILESLKARKSVRAFTGEHISRARKQLILEAAVNAPTAGNQQLYTILDITDQQLKETLSESCDHQPFIAKADMVLVFCADCKKWYDLFLAEGCQPRKPGVGDLMLAVTDTAIAAQNAVTAAESLGIGSCYIGDILEQYEIHRQVLKLPDYVMPCCMVVFGFPTDQQRARQKPRRCGMEHIVHENTYRSMEHQELTEMLSHNAVGRTFPEWVRAFCARKYNSDFSREMTRSVKQYMKEFE